MIMGKDDAVRLVPQSRFYNQPRIDRRFIQGSLMNQGCMIHTILSIKANDIENFVWPSGKQGNGKFAGSCRCAEDWPLSPALFEVTAGKSSGPRPKDSRRERSTATAFNHAKN